MFEYNPSSIWSASMELVLRLITAFYACIIDEHLEVYVDLGASCPVVLLTLGRQKLIELCSWSLK